MWNGRITTRVHTAGGGARSCSSTAPAVSSGIAFLDGLAERFTVYAPEHPGTTPGDPDGIRALDHLWDLVLYYDELFDAPRPRRARGDRPLLRRDGRGRGGRHVPRTGLEAGAHQPLGLWRDDTPIPNFLVMTPDEFVPLMVADQRGRSPSGSAPPDLESEARPDAVIQMTWSLACTGKFFWPIPDRGLARASTGSAPTLVVWGHRDGLVQSRLHADEFARRIRDARVEVLENAAHMPHLERLDVVSPMMKSFLGP